jgi:N-acetylmuramoyl-L-alanine amidase
VGCGASGPGPERDVVGLDPSSGDLARARLAARERELRRELARRRAAQRPRVPVAGKPMIRQMPIPFPERRRSEMVAYAERHYGMSTYRLREPKVIVEHYTASGDARSAYNTFAADVADSELHELPGTCAHFVVDRDGTIYQLVPVTTMCRHTVGLNYTAIGIEHAGFSDGEILGNQAQMSASLKLTNWLRCSYGISMENVIGHNESLSSPYHRERVASLRSQTHGDWTREHMDVYRERLGRQNCG